jgi:hypothetical protein
MSTKRVVLCGGKTCCPEALFEADGTVKLVDDNGITVTLTAEQADLFCEAVAEQKKAPHA